ncbi:MAG: nuclear transport factor 2 family protein [Zoogloeaceae bacterium]|jgi:ketosteroid isomerase-like protein|nr:nuclear transport factor 2 family protein [Zoogloeaceae bacterium]
MTTAMSLCATNGDRRRWRVALLCLGLFLFACGRADDPQVALEAGVHELQSALEEKDIRRVLSLLSEDFAAPMPGEGRDWARKTMLRMFARYRNIRIVVLSSESRIDDKTPDRAVSVVKVALTGAEGLIPDSARQFQVRMGWIRTDDKWKLIRLEWE